MATNFVRSAKTHVT